MKQIILTSLTTISIGIILYIFHNIIILPIIEFGKIKSEVIEKLLYYINIISNPINNEISSKYEEETSNELRKLASKLMSKYYLIKIKFTFIFLRIIPSKKKIKYCSSLLIGVSNSLYPNNGKENQKDIGELLKLLRLEKYLP